jgi:hypothetical protein
MFDLDLAGLEDLTVSRSSWGVLLARSSWGFAAGGDAPSLLAVVLVALLIAAAALSAFRLAVPAVAAAVTFLVAVLALLLL